MYQCFHLIYLIYLIYLVRLSILSILSVYLSSDTLFVCVGLLVSTIPFLTFALPIAEAGALLDSSMSIYLLNILVSGFILAATYLQNCKQHLSIYSTLLKDGPDHVDSQVAATDRGRQLLEEYEAFRANAEQTAHRKAVNFSFFSVNLTFMLAYLGLSFLFHEPLSEVSDVWRFVLTTDLAALAALALGSSGFYKLLSENTKLI